MLTNRKLLAPCMPRFELDEPHMQYISSDRLLCPCSMLHVYFPQVFVKSPAFN